MKLFNWIKRLFINSKINKVRQKCKVLNNVFDNPEKMILTAYIEGDEIVVKIKPRIEETETE